MATAARNSAKAAGDVIGGSPKQANGAIAVLALIAGRNNLQIATAVRGRNAVQCSAVQCSAVAAAAAMPRALWGDRGEKRNLARLCRQRAVVGGALRFTRENPTDPCVHADADADSLAWHLGRAAQNYTISTYNR